MAIGDNASDQHGSGLSKFIRGAGSSASAPVVANTNVVTSNNKPTPTVIGPEALIKGDLKSKGDLVVSGVIEGDLSSDAKIVIAPGGSVVGRVIGVEVVIEGRVTGDTQALKTLSIMSSAHVRGDVETPVIMIEPGAAFVGRCSMVGDANKA